MEILSDHWPSPTAWVGLQLVELSKRSVKPFGKNLQPIVMPEPNEEIRRASEEVFKEKWNFPHCVAAIDGKHVRIQAHPHRGSEFVNYKKYHSVVLLALADADTVIPRLTKIIRSGITFVSRNVISRRFL